MKWFLIRYRPKLKLLGITVAEEIFSALKNEEKDEKNKIKKDDEETQKDNVVFQQACTKCVFYKDMYKALKKKCRSLETELEGAGNEVSRLKGKLKVRKEKYRNLKRQVKLEGTRLDNNLVQIGSSTLVSREKLNFCRKSTPNKFVGNLLDVVFGCRHQAN